MRRCNDALSESDETKERGAGCMVGMWDESRGAA